MKSLINKRWLPNPHTDKVQVLKLVEDVIRDLTEMTRTHNLARYYSHMRNQVKAIGLRGEITYPSEDVYDALDKMNAANKANKDNKNNN